MKCDEKNCKGIARYNYTGKKVPLKCPKHKKRTMVNVNKKMCEKCGTKGALYNYHGQKKKFCGTHKKPGMINVDKKMCRCGKHQATYNFPNIRTRVCCHLCKETGMINKNMKKCKCGKMLPSFALPGLTREYCRLCKLPGMIKVKKTVCKCGLSQPSFNYKGLPAKFCAKCKKAGMIYLHNLCKKCNDSLAKYNIEYSKYPSHCEDCKEDGMIRISFIRCACGRAATHGISGSKKGTACVRHKTDDMVRVYRINCNEKDCKKTATHGIPNNPCEKCLLHRTSEMIINPRKKCKTKNCNEVATFGVKVPISCETHKTKDDICLVERTCIKCNRIDVLSSNKLCINFCEAEEKYKIYKKLSKSKEESLFNVLKHAFPDFPPRRENIEDASCTLARTDFEFDCKTHIIIVECDEYGDSHASKRCSLGIEGDQNRMKNICFAYGGTPVVFLRFNPDKYKTKEGSFSIKTREKMLISIINYFIENKPVSQYSVAYLFFNGFTTFSENYFEIDPYDTHIYECPFCETTLTIKSTLYSHCKNCKNVPDNFFGIDENNIYFLENP